MNTKKPNRFMPLIMALCVIAGILIGTFYANHFSGNRLNIINSGSNRLSNLLHIINDQYVDKVDIDSLVDIAIPQILADLDPHSVYISAKDAQAVADDLKGSFSGVGIEFTIRQDTIRVQNVVKNGPAQRAGIIAGDKIVSVDGKPFVGKIVTNEEAMRRLKGPKDTKVKLGVVRYGQKAVKYFTITRGDIPQKSITAAYMLDENTGYIKVRSFGETTYPEMLIALAQLSQEGFQNLVIDLRDNTGGYMNSAVQMANEFTIRQDTIRVQNVVKNGPAQRAGIIAGDKIVSVDGKPFVGKIVTNEEAMRRLKGPKDTKVKLGVVRYGQKAVKYFTITRGDIPQKSITAAYMLDENTGYIKVRSFGETTYPEMLIALAQLSQEGFQNLVIDLRDNTGGYMNSAVQMANEFLPKNKLIVYMEGRKSPRQDFRSDGHGSYQKLPLCVLINEGSASASEIFAGAIQDNDRGTIIGRRSFGKGLVQQQIGFPDGSMIRLTIARYYTPSGRCIQKPFTAGDTKDYESDIVTRYEHGEFFSQDSIKHQGPAYHTGIGRTVYGGGGITPDIFVPEDTLGMTSYYKQAAMSGLILQFAFTYTDNNRPKLNTFRDMMAMSKYLVQQNTVEKFAAYADKNGLKRRNLMIRKSHKLLEKFINSRIIYNIMDDEAWTAYLNLDDPTIERALVVFKNHAAFPKKPVIKK